MLVLCFTLSGAAGLVFESLWAQEFGLVFGASEQAVVCVLAAYMAGIGGGAWLAARVLARVRRPLLAYAGLEIGVAACALGVPSAIAAAARLQAAWLGGAGLGSAAGMGAVASFHFASSFAILLLPTVLMGATLPLLARHAVSGDGELGPRVAWLYAANTLGAAAGAVACAFVLLPSYGLERAAHVGIGLELLAAALALLLAWRCPTAPLPPEAPTTTSGGSTWVLWVVAVSGAASLGTEVLWTRLLTHLLGSSVYSFSCMLASYLVGIGLGAAAAARVARAGGRAHRWLAVAQLGAALSLLGAFALADTAPGALLRLSGASGHSLVSGMVFCAALMLPGAACFGASFPLAVRVLALRAGEAGQASGRLLAWNTLGALGGAAGVGLWLLPWLRFEGVVRAAAGASLAAALLASLAARPRLRGPGLAAVAGLLFVAVAPPGPPWRVLRSSPMTPSPGAGPGHDPGEPRGFGPVVFYATGRNATVLLHAEGSEWRLTGNGLPESAVQPRGARSARYGVARLLTLLPQAVRTGVRHQLVIGLGGGHTIEELPAALQSVDVVELEPEVLAANRLLARVRRQDPLADPRTRVHLGDARAALALGRQPFDAIVSQPSHPWTAGSSHLFTREFFGQVASRLRPGGVFVQWIGLEFVDEPLFRSLLATLLAVFPEVELFTPTAGGAALFVASDRPLELPAPASAAISADPGPWRSMGCLVAEDVLALRLLDARGARRVAQGGDPNLDRRNLLQARSPLVLDAPLRLQGLTRLVASEDAAGRLPAAADGLYLVRRFLEVGEPARALRAAATLPDEEDRRVAFTLIDLAAGRPGVAEAAWARRSASGAGPFAPRAESEERAALLVHFRAALLSGRGPLGLAAWIVREPAAAALLDAWRRIEHGEDGRAVEPRLAVVDPHHPLFRLATRLRVVWRAATGSPAEARDGLELLDALVAWNARPSDLVLRARLGLRAEDADVALASLDELTRAWKGRLAPGVVAEARAVLAAVPREARQDLRAEIETRLASPRP